MARGRLAVVSSWLPWTSCQSVLPFSTSGARAARPGAAPDWGTRAGYNAAPLAHLIGDFVGLPTPDDNRRLPPVGTHKSTDRFQLVGGISAPCATHHARAVRYLRPQTTSRSTLIIDTERTYRRPPAAITGECPIEVWLASLRSVRRDIVSGPCRCSSRGRAATGAALAASNRTAK